MGETTEIRDGRTYYGRIWAPGEYGNPIHPSIFDMRVGSGQRVWSIIGYLETYGWDIDAVTKLFEGLTREDVLAAIEFYNQHKKDIDERLAEDASLV